MLTRTLDNAQHLPKDSAAGDNENVSNTLDTDTRNDVFESEFKESATWSPQQHASSAQNHSSRPATNWNTVSVATRATSEFHAQEKSAADLTNSTKSSKQTSSTNIKPNWNVTGPKENVLICWKNQTILDL